MPDFYIGFQRLTEFMDALDPQHDVYLAPLSLVKSGEHISTCTASLIASQARHDHLIYCKIDVSRWHEIRGEPFGPTDRERAARAKTLQDQMWRLIVEKMRADHPDLELHEGAPSFPSDLMLIPGSIDGIVYDADLHEFVRKAARRHNKTSGPGIEMIACPKCGMTVKARGLLVHQRGSKCRAGQNYTRPAE